MAKPIIDTHQWPLVYYVMPERVSDEETETHIRALQSIIDRQQPYVLIFSGVELPTDSAHFLREYKAWGKRTHAGQQLYCRGAVRVEPDDEKRNAMWRKAQRYITDSSIIPYPYRVVASDLEARQQAEQWLKGDLP